MKHHPDRNQGDAAKAAERNSRRPKRPTKCCPTRRRRPRTTSTATRAWTPTCVVAGWRGRLRWFRRCLRRHLGDISVAHAAASAAAVRCTAAPTSPTRWRSRSRRPPPAGNADPHPLVGQLRNLQRHRRQARHQREDLHHLPRAGFGADAPGLLQRAADLPHLPRPGQDHSEPCTTCHGQGKIKKQKTLEIKIPAGIDDGQRIRSTGNGEPGQNGGPSGDLYIEVAAAQARHL